MPGRMVLKRDIVRFLEHLKAEYSSMPKGCMKEINSALKFWGSDLK